MKTLPESIEEALFFLHAAGCPADVIAHCKAVARKAEAVAGQINSKTPVDVNLVRIGALLHDIGRAQSHGIDHGVIGAEIAADLGCTENVIRIIEVHIGAGITKNEAVKLGLPSKDYCPVRIEEKIVAHADNLTKGTTYQLISQCIKALRQKGADETTVKRISGLHEELSVLVGGIL